MNTVRYLSADRPTRLRNMLDHRTGTVLFFTPANPPWHEGGIPCVRPDFQEKVEFWHQTEPAP